VFQTIVPLLIEAGVPLSEALASAGQMPPATRTIEADPERFLQLLSEPRFATLVDVRLAYRVHTNKEFGETMNALERILADSETSLGGR
jgi:hypothetical protein